MFDVRGYVGGAVFVDDHTVSHIVTGDPQTVDALGSSKDLQSYTGELFNRVRGLSEKGKQVSICGTPAVLLNSENGRDFFHSLGNVVFYQACALQEVAAGNPALGQTLERKPGQGRVFDGIDAMSFGRLSREYSPMPRCVRENDDGALCKG